MFQGFEGNYNINGTIRDVQGASITFFIAKIRPRKLPASDCDCIGIDFNPNRGIGDLGQERRPITFAGSDIQYVFAAAEFAR